MVVEVPDPLGVVQPLLLGSILFRDDHDFVDPVGKFLCTRPDRHFVARFQLIQLTENRAEDVVMATHDDIADFAQTDAVFVPTRGIFGYIPLTKDLTVSIFI